MSPEKMELARYEAAVWDNPREAGEGPMSYIARIAEIVAGKPVPYVKVIPPVARLPYRDDSGLRLDVDGGR